MYFLEIGTDNDHVHFSIQSVPTYSAIKIVTVVKNITAREIFKLNPEVKKQLLGGEFWSVGYFVNTVSKFGDEKTIHIIFDYKVNQKSINKYTNLISLNYF